MSSEPQAPEPVTILPKGRVIFYDPERRFGFLVDESKNKFFFDTSALGEEAAAPLVGERVQFQPMEHRRGRRARRVHRVAPRRRRSALLRELDEALHAWSTAEEAK